jgi:hypothetical protein
MQLSKLISIILHPIFMPLLALHLTLKALPSVAFAISQYLNYIYGIVICCTIILPLLSIFFLMRKGRVGSLEISNHKERSLPLFITALWMSLGFFMLNNILFYAPILKAEIIGAILIILFAAIISKFWKISLHLLGIGGVVGVFIALQLITGGVLYLLIIFILLSGILGVARIKQKAHNHTQVYVGFLLGMSVELITLLLY